MPGEWKLELLCWPKLLLYVRHFCLCPAIDYVDWLS